MSPRRLGIMQGRLSPKHPALLQSFPHAFWRDEFDRAQELGFDSIEWLVDDEDLALNPLFHSEGRRDLGQVMARTGVKIESLCAHVLMEGAIGRSGADGAKARNLLGKILRTSADFGVNSVVLPLMDGASVRDGGRCMEALVENLRLVLRQAPDASVICLESDLPAGQMISLLDCIGHARVGVCYDLGNATALGFDLAAEIACLSDAIREVHIKDRVVGGGSVMLGQGDTAFGPAFRALSATGYGGTVIMETPVGDDWRAAARDHLAFARSVDAAFWETESAC